jgi:hypothetical protein
MKRHIISTLICSLLVIASSGVVMGQRRTTVDRLTGTYQLDPARSDDIRTALNRAARGLTADERERVQNTLMRRLESPEMLAIDRRGQTITIASTLASQLTLTADGRVRSEQGPRGNTTNVRATLSGDRLVINTDNNRARDYSVTFEPQGSLLRVTRSISINRLPQPVTITSIYDKISTVADMNLQGDDDLALRQPAGNARGYVPSGTQMVAVLSNNLSTKEARDGDRFTMRVESPGGYDGAVIEGFVSDVDRSGPFTGRADLKFNFERIRLPGGRTYDFAANINSVRTPDGEDVRIEEGRVEEKDSQTSETITRSGIGAAIGALIGAVTGGGEGAAIGAAVGAGAGAGSVYVTGRDDLELIPGTEFVLEAATPRPS